RTYVEAAALPAIDLADEIAVPERPAPAARAVSALQDRAGEARARELERRGEARDPRAEDDHVASRAEAARQARRSRIGLGHAEQAHRRHGLVERRRPAAAPHQVQKTPPRQPRARHALPHPPNPDAMD